MIDEIYRNDARREEVWVDGVLERDAGEVPFRESLVIPLRCYLQDDRMVGTQITSGAEPRVRGRTTHLLPQGYTIQPRD